MASPDWRQGIADAARPTLEAQGEGAVIIGLNAQGENVLISRFFAYSDYNDSRKLSAVVWARATRWQNEDCEGRYYVVHRYADGTITVWNGRHCFLWNEPGEG